MDMDMEVNMEEGSEEGSSGDTNCDIEDEADYTGFKKPKPKPEYMQFYKYSAQADGDYWVQMGLVPDVGKKRLRQGYTDADLTEW